MKERKKMATRTKNKTPRKKPMAGSRVQQLCPAPPNWRVLMLLVDDDEDKVVVDKGGAPQSFLEDIACWALIVDEDKASRYQQIWPCIAEASGVLEPICPDETPSYIGLVPPSYDDDQIEDMVRELFDSFGSEVETVVMDDESDGTDSDEDDEEGPDSAEQESDDDEDEPEGKTDA